MTLPRPTLLSRPTVSYPGEWDSLVGQSFARIVLTECRACGSLRYGTGVHSPHRDAAGQLVDCQGREVKP